MHKKPLLYSHFSERTTTDIYIAKILVLISIWLKYPMKIVVFSLASWVIDGDHQIWQLPEGEKAALPVLLHYCHLYIMETLGNSLGWQGWIYWRRVSSCEMQPYRYSENSQLHCRYKTRHKWAVYVSLIAMLSYYMPLQQGTEPMIPVYSIWRLILQSISFASLTSLPNLGMPGYPG